MSRSVTLIFLPLSVVQIVNVKVLNPPNVVTLMINLKRNQNEIWSRLLIPHESLEPSEKTADV